MFAIGKGREGKSSSPKPLSNQPPSQYLPSRHASLRQTSSSLKALLILAISVLVLFGLVWRLNSSTNSTLARWSHERGVAHLKSNGRNYVTQTRFSSNTTTERSLNHPNGPKAGRSPLNKGVKVREITVKAVVPGKKPSSTVAATSLENTIGPGTVRNPSTVVAPTDAAQPHAAERSIIEARAEVDEEEEAGAEDVIMTPLPNILAECDAELHKSNNPPGQALPPRMCDPSKCMYCEHFPPHSTPSQDEDITEATKAYLKNHVLFAVVTGSFGNYSRLDLAYCTWLQSVPLENLYLISDKIPRPEGTRVGQWVQGAIPDGHSFNHKQQAAKEGYTIGWHRAQFRFMLGIDLLVRRSIGGTSAEKGSGGITGLRWARDSQDSEPHLSPHDTNDEGDNEVNAVPVGPYSLPPLLPAASDEHIKWIAVIDDDTFINVNSLVKYFMRLDTANESDPTANPIYIGDRGWGGAGHYFNRAAMHSLQKGLFDRCILPHMMKGAKASDEALKKCLPHVHLGPSAAAVAAMPASPTPRMRIINDKLFSHCQANFLRARLLKGDHIASHIKRDLSGPLPLQALRARLYYQVAYRANATCAYKLLMHFGACAYGSSCKLKHCDEGHDNTAVADYEAILNEGRLGDL